MDGGGKKEVSMQGRSSVRWASGAPDAVVKQSVYKARVCSRGRAEVRKGKQSKLAVASALLVILINADGVWVIGIEFGLGLLLKRSSGDGLEGLFDIDGLLGAGFKVRNVALALTPSHGPFLRNHAFALLDIDLVA